MELHVGCAMWTYAPWQGRYLPGSLPPRDRLRAYATWCNAVEGNTTFYAVPTAGTVRSWAEQTAPDFRFILKLPKSITHERRLADVDDPLRAFLGAIEPLGGRAHTLWIQLPPSFSPAGLGALPASCAASRGSTGTASRSGTGRSSRPAIGTAARGRAG